MRLQNIFVYITALALVAINLDARENPFIPTQSYLEKKAEIVDDSYQYEVEPKVMEKANDVMVVEEDDLEVMDSENSYEVEEPEMNMSKKETMPSKKMLHSGKHNFLSFVILEVTDDKLTITTHNQVIKKFDLNYKDTKKIVFDFKSSKSFYSKKAFLESMNFKHISIGSHPNEGYYRIAISVEDIPSNYDVVYEGDSILITKAQM